jgi:hypothetical protein
VTSTRNRRAWSIDSVLHRYFQIKDAGPPSCTINLTDVHVESPERPPRWLVRLCDVGIAIEKLTPPQKEAVVTRWEAVIGQEDAERDLVVLDMKQARIRREGGDWRAVDEEKEMVRARHHKQWKARRRFEQRRAYFCGMDDLEQILLDNES